MTGILALDITYYVLVFVFGSVIGSFLNVVILRTPLHQSIITEPSHCFSCGNRLKWYDMFPVFSWIILRGKCRFCGAKISPRYMIFEAVCGASYLLAFLRFAPSEQWWAFGFSAVLFPILIVLSGIDMDHFQIPYWCSISVAVLGIAAFFLFPETPWYERLIAMGVVLVLFVILVLIGGMGGGDLQLMAGASLLLGYKVFIALFVGIVLGAIYGSVKKLKDRADEKSISEQIKQIAEQWYQDQLDRDIGYVKENNEDIIVGSISDGEPDIEWEFLDEAAWKGIPDKSALSRTLREHIKDEREGGFKIIIKEDRIEKVKYSRRMVFGPFLAIGITTAWLVGDIIWNWYMNML
ncbi:MAG: prepilin peptidase [Oscillospiraceae bacterium]